MFFQKYNLPAWIPSCVWNWKVTVYQGPNELGYWTYATDFHGNKSGGICNHVGSSANKLDVFPCRFDALLKIKKKRDKASVPNLFCRLGDCPDAAPSLSDCQWARADALKWFRHKHGQWPHWLNPSRAVFNPIKKGVEPKEQSCDKHRHPSCWGTGDTGIDSGESRHSLSKGSKGQMLHKTQAGCNKSDLNSHL